MHSFIFIFAILFLFSSAIARPIYETRGFFAPKQANVTQSNVTQANVPKQKQDPMFGRWIDVQETDFLDSPSLKKALLNYIVR